MMDDSVILQGCINESYVSAVEELSQKTHSLCQLEEHEMMAARDVFPQMNQLKQAVCVSHVLLYAPMLVFSHSLPLSLLIGL